EFRRVLFRSFIPSTLHKLRDARRRIDAWVQAGGQPIRLEVDGGVKVDNIGAIHAAGADTFVAGSAVFGAPDYRTVIDAMRAEIRSEERRVGKECRPGMSRWLARR